MYLSAYYLLSSQVDGYTYLHCIYLSIGGGWVPINSSNYCFLCIASELISVYLCIGGGWVPIYMLFAYLLEVDWYLHLLIRFSPPYLKHLLI